MLDIDNIVRTAAQECDIKSNELNNEKIIELVSKSLTKLIESSEFIDYLSNELDFKWK